MPETETAKKSSCGCSGHSAHASPATDTTNQTGHIDPVCGMTVIPEKAAASHLFEGTTYYFCNPGCKTRFAGNEEYYLTGKHKEDAAKAAAVAPADTIYFCPMHPEVQSPTFDSCPKCGMALEPMGGAPSDSDPELEDMTRRFKFALSFTAPLFVISMGSMLLMPFIHQYLDHQLLNIVQLFLAIPVVFYGGSVFFKRAWQSVQNKSPNMFTLIAAGVGVAFFYSLTVTILPGLLPESLLGHGGVPHVYFEAASVIITLALLGQVLECRARAKTTDAIRSLLALTPETVLLVTEGAPDRETAVEDVQPGDILRIRPGERICLDGKIVEGVSAIDESTMTGEPLPVTREAGDTVLGGTLNGTGSFTMLVERTGKDTVLARIVETARQAQLSRIPLQDAVDKVAEYFVPAVVLSALATFVGWMVFGPAPALIFALVNAIAVLIIACPCALGLASPMSVTVGVGRGALEGILIKNAAALQHLATVDTVVLDKTGTITEGRPVVEQIVTAGELDEASVLQLAASLEANSEHPLARAILEARTRADLPLLSVRAFNAAPGLGASAWVDGKAVVLGSERFLNGMGIDTASLAKPAEGTAVYLAVNGRAVGLIQMTDRIKSDAAETIGLLKSRDLRVILLSGDNSTTAEVVGKIVGLSANDIHGGMLPDEKAAFIADLKKRGRKVAMAGDGINDAPALATAHVGIAMGDGTDIAAESADIVLVKGDLAGVLRALNLSRAVLGNIKTNLWLAFGYNALAIPLAAGLLYPVFGLLLNPMVAALAMSLSSVSVISNSLRLKQVDLRK
ncbi:MAG: cadmium-translocating P-type ATPase [Candidatus Obscuribacterales bacterium]|nr:cadmium-translocating P-type ATPase [Candidatus Obscuribacterales bacterium]